MRRRRPADDRGTTLVELLVAMTILATFFAVFSTVAGRLFDSSKDQQSRSLNLDNNRNIVELLDRQVRYASAINEPVDTATGQYVLWLGTSPDLVPTCYEWQVTAGLMQYRSWVVPAAAAVAVPTAWKTVGNGVVPAGSDEFFSITPSADPTDAAQGASQNRQQLRVVFSTSHGTPAVGTDTRVAFTALNSRSAAAPAALVCQGVAP